MEPVAPTSDTQQVNVLIHGCIDENDRTTLCFRTMWGTIFRPIPSPRRLFPNTRPFYVEYQFQGMKVGQLAPITEDSIHQLVIDAPTAPRLHRTLLIRDANFPTHWLIDAVDERYPRRLDPTSDLPFAQASSSTSSEQQATQTFSSTSEQQLIQCSNPAATEAAAEPAADADGDALLTGTSSPSSTSSHVSNELSCSGLLAFLAQDDPNVMAKGFALEAARAEEARETRERQDELDREAQPAPAPAPEVVREPRSSTRLTAPNNATTTAERSRSRGAYSSGDNSSGNDRTGTNATASMEASASSLATIASYTSNGSPVAMEPWALNTDSPAASLHLVPPPSANRPCPLQPYMDEYLRHNRRVNSVSFNRGLQNLMSPDGRVRTPQEVQRRHEEIERASEMRQARRLEEMRSNRVALSHLPSLGAPGPSRRSGNEGDDERYSDQSYSSKETTTTSESSAAAESEKENENVSNENREGDEENRGLGPSGTIRGRKGKGKGKERERSDDDDDDEKKKGESSSSPGKRRKSLPKWDGQK